MDDEDIFFPVDAVKITYNSKFSSALSHRDFLGSILGLGIERVKIGDILVYDGEAYCFADSSISSYIAANLEKAGRTKVSAKITDLNLVKLPEKRIDVKNVTVSSLRADTVFGAVIRAERASVNWCTVKSVSDTIKEGDVLSLKGSGRGVLMEIGGTTKKGRIVITVGRYI